MALNAARLKAAIIANLEAEGDPSLTTNTVGLASITALADAIANAVVTEITTNAQVTALATAVTTGTATAPVTGTVS